MRSAAGSAWARREQANPSGGVMAQRRNSGGASEALVPPAPSLSEDEALDCLVASLSRLNMDQLRLRWRNHLGGVAPAHLPGWLLMRLLAYRIQAAAFGDLDRAILRRLREPRDGNGILRAETGGRFQAQNTGERPEFGSQTATRLANRRELRGFLPTRKPRRFARTGWWRTQSRQTGLRRSRSLRESGKAYR